MRVLGIDPGLGCTGYAVIESRPSAGRRVTTDGIIVREAGVIRPQARQPLAPRLKHVYEAVCGLIQRYQPEVVALEELYSHYQHPRTAIIMGHVRGVICLAASVHNITVVGYAARRVKQVLTGTGAAPKEQVQRAVQQWLGLATLPSPHDVADALALAIAHIHMKRSCV